MLITKKFRVESAHIVRNCTSHRCSHSIHGHSAVIEVAFEAHSLDNAQMVYDFGLMKSTIKEFIDSMDHCYLLCKYDNKEFKDFIKKSCDRWIELPFNPSAEMLSMFIFKGVDYILNHTFTRNGEGDIKVHSVRYWETESGSATCFREDVDSMFVDQAGSSIQVESINYSEGVTRDWGVNLADVIFEDVCVDNPEVKQQINLK